MKKNELVLGLIGKASSNIKIMWFFTLKTQFSLKNDNLQSDDVLC